METLLNYFHEPPIVVLDQPPALAKKASEFLDEAADAYLRLGDVAEEKGYSSPEHLYADWTELSTAMQPWSWLALEPLATGGPEWQPIVTFPAQSPGSVGLAQRGTPFHETLAKLNQLRLVGPVVIVARTRGQLDRLLSLFAEQDLPATTWKPHEWKVSSQKSPFGLIQGNLSTGFVSTDGRLTLITEEELRQGHAPSAGPEEQDSDISVLIGRLEDRRLCRPRSARDCAL
jgi:transcription-repair coupling factor (superfamily II helicase)